MTMGGASGITRVATNCPESDRELSSGAGAQTHEGRAHLGSGVWTVPSVTSVDIPAGWLVASLKAIPSFSLAIPEVL